MDGKDQRERILDAAQALLHRLGPAKMGVVDVARALGMSHANVYRHFPSKAALQDAVAERWLASVSHPLAAVAAGPEPPAARLEAWLWALIRAKRRKVLDDPQMFAAYHVMAEQARATVERHVAELRSQLARIVAEGVAAGQFRATDPAAASRAVLQATAVFHHPHFVADPVLRGSDADAEATIALVIAGLSAPPHPSDGADPVGSAQMAR